jgi:hypothetical protein
MRRPIKRGKRSRPRWRARSGAPKSQRRNRTAWRFSRNVLIAGIGGAVTVYLVAGTERFGDLVFGTDPPLHVTAAVRSPFNVCEGGRGWVFHHEAKGLSTPGPQQDMDGWAAESGGIPASDNLIAVQLQGSGSKTVIVTDLRVEVTRRRPPPGGAHTTTPGGCGDLVPTYFKADLDRRPIRLLPITGQDVNGNPVPPAPLPHAVSRQEPEVWYIKAITHRCDCEWVAHIDWISDGERGSIKVTENGHPFRTATSTRALEVNSSRGTWMPVEAPGLRGGDRLLSYGEPITLKGSSYYVRGGVTLLAQRFPFEAPYQPVATDPVGRLSPFAFTRRPTVATRYKAALSTDLRAASKAVTVYVTPLLGNSSTTIERARRDRGAPRLRQVGTVSARIPSKLAALPGAQIVLVYFGAAKGQRSPTLLRLADEVELRRSHGMLWSAHVSFPLKDLPSPPRSTQTFFCIPISYEELGLGVPRPDSPCGKRWIAAPRSP